MARRKAPATTAPRAVVLVPPELAMGRCADVWAETVPLPVQGWPISAWTRYTRAWFQFQRQHALDGRASAELPHPGAPWRLDDADADERLARLGLGRGDVPGLRRAAQARVPAERAHKEAT